MSDPLAALPADIATRRAAFFALDQPITLTRAEWDRYWPYVDNIWSLRREYPARKYRPRGVRYSIWYDCRLHSTKARVQSSPDPSAEPPKSKRNKTSRDAVSCLMGAVAVFDGDSVTFSRLDRADCHEWHTLDESDRRVPTAIMDLATGLISQGHEPGKVFCTLSGADSAADRVRICDAGGAHLSLKAVFNVLQARRHLHPDLRRRDSEDSVIVQEQGVVDWSAIEKAVTAWVRDYMSQPQFDGSHDFTHIERVVSNAKQIYSVEAGRPDTWCGNKTIVILAALLHDVGDHKYTDANAVSATPVRDALISFGVGEFEAIYVQNVVDAVSYSKEVKRAPGDMAALIAKYPEIAIVQDADRLDAIGAVGISRTFAFGGARGRKLDDTLEHFEEKLFKIEDMMKTDAGRKVAQARTAKMRVFEQWWKAECNVEKLP